MPSSPPMLMSLASHSLGNGAKRRECARWAGVGSRLDSKMAAVSGRSKWWSLVTQIGQLHRWSVSTMDGDDSTVTKLLGESILGRRGVVYPGLLGLSGAVSLGSGLAIGVESLTLGGRSPEVSV